MTTPQLREPHWGYLFELSTEEKVGSRRAEPAEAAQAAEPALKDWRVRRVGKKNSGSTGTLRESSVYLSYFGLNINGSGCIKFALQASTCHTDSAVQSNHDISSPSLAEALNIFGYSYSTPKIPPKQPSCTPSCEHWQRRWRHPTPQRCVGRLLGFPPLASRMPRQGHRRHTQLPATTARCSFRTLCHL